MPSKYPPMTLIRESSVRGTEMLRPSTVTVYLVIPSRHIRFTDKFALEVTLDDQSVFEDVNPRIADVTGDGQNDIIVIESRTDQGASLAIYGIENDELKKIASTPFIGTPNRWLAPIGTADFNSDGVNDVAYVQTPHLASVLKIWSFKNK